MIMPELNDDHPINRPQGVTVETASIARAREICLAGYVYLYCIILLYTLVIVYVTR
jgi:hypothetical protein